MPAIKEGGSGSDQSVGEQVGLGITSLTSSPVVDKGDWIQNANALNEQAKKLTVMKLPNRSRGFEEFKKVYASAVELLGDLPKMERLAQAITSPSLANIRTLEKSLTSFVDVFPDVSNVSNKQYKNKYNEAETKLNAANDSIKAIRKYFNADAVHSL